MKIGVHTARSMMPHVFVMECVDDMAGTIRHGP